MALSRGQATNTVVQGALVGLRQLAEEQNFPEHRLKQMQFKIDCNYDINVDRMMLSVAWSDPEGEGRRSFQLTLNGSMMRSGGSLEEIRMAIEQINLRGELFYFKLHRHFPNRIENVHCGRDGRVTVVFKNGRSLTTNEADLDSTEFLATCGMIYDL